MNRGTTLVAVAVLGLAVAACGEDLPPPIVSATPISETDAGRIADATVAVWSSMDAAKIKGLYGPGVQGFDYQIGPLSTDRAAWDRAQDIFAAGKIDKYVQRERSIQVVDADTFIVSGTWEGTSTALPANNGAVRCTDVYEKSFDGTWPIINEHCSVVPGQPKGAAAPAPQPVASTSS